MTFKVVTPVATEPVTLAEARLQCKVDSDDTSHDALITGLITAAREFAEHYTGRALASQTLEMALDCFPGVSEWSIGKCTPDPMDDFIDLDMPPVATITSVKYTDTAGVEQTVSSGDYALSLYGDSRRVAPTYGKYWPTTRDIPNAVRILYVTGYTTAPKAVKAAILLHVEIECPLVPHTPAEREALEKARDSLLNTVKVYGF